MGAFPIQTDTSCCDEWFEHGKGGYLIPPNDVDLIAERVRSALTDDSLVDQAAVINWRVIETRLDQREVKRRTWAFYDEIFNALDQSREAKGTVKEDIATEEDKRLVVVPASMPHVKLQPSADGPRHPPPRNRDRA